MWIFPVFGVSFLVALTGAVSPGPLLTYTIIKTAESKKRGYLEAVWIIAGHAVAESLIVMLLLSGFATLLKGSFMVRAIGLAGGGLLVLFGLVTLRDAATGEASINGSVLAAQSAGAKTAPPRDTTPRRLFANPVCGGALVSMSNPYWWVWWATIGLAIMLELDVTLGDPLRLAVFFIGHQCGDLAWYLLVSCLVYFGIKKIRSYVYAGILAACGIIMVLFGVYLAVAPFSG